LIDAQKLNITYKKTFENIFKGFMSLSK